MLPVQLRRLTGFGFDYDFHGPPTLLLQSDYGWYRVRSAAKDYQYYWRMVSDSTELVNCVLTKLIDSPGAVDWQDILERVGGSILLLIIV
jgi:hypothetical protein